MDAFRHVWILLVLSLVATSASSAPITFNTALPVAKGEFINRELLVLNRSGDDPSGGGRVAASVANDFILLLCVDQYGCACKTSG